MDAISVAHLSIKRNLRVNYGGVGEAYLRGIIVVASNAFVYTNAPNHPFPPKRKWVILLLVEALPQSPQNTKLCSWTQDKSCGYAIFQIAG